METDLPTGLKPEAWRRKRVVYLVVAAAWGSGTPRHGFGHLIDLALSGRGLATRCLWVLGQFAYWPWGLSFLR